MSGFPWQQLRWKHDNGFGKPDQVLVKQYCWFKNHKFVLVSLYLSS